MGDYADLEKRLRNDGSSWAQKMFDEAADAITVLRVERDAAIARAEAAETKADREYAGMSVQINEIVCAKAATDALLREAGEKIEPFAKLHVTRFMTNGIRYEFRVDAAWIRALTDLAARITAATQTETGGENE